MAGAALGDVHAFVSHSWRDDGSAKYDCLHEWAEEVVAALEPDDEVELDRDHLTWKQFARLGDGLHEVVKVVKQSRAPDPAGEPLGDPEPLRAAALAEAAGCTFEVHEQSTRDRVEQHAAKLNAAAEAFLACAVPADLLDRPFEPERPQGFYDLALT